MWRIGRLTRWVTVGAVAGGAVLAGVAAESLPGHGASASTGSTGSVTGSGTSGTGSGVTGTEGSDGSGGIASNPGSGDDLGAPAQAPQQVQPQPVQVQPQPVVQSGGS